MSDEPKKPSFFPKRKNGRPKSIDLAKMAEDTARECDFNPFRNLIKIARNEDDEGNIGAGDIPIEQQRLASSDLAKYLTPAKKSSEPPESKDEKNITVNLKLPAGIISARPDSKPDQKAKGKRVDGKP